MSDLTPRTTSVVVYQGDDLERLGELRRKAEIASRQADAEYEAAEEKASGAALRMGDEVSLVEARKARDEAKKPSQNAYDAAVDEAADRALIFTVEAMKRTPFRELLAEHPPREKNAEDEAYGVNVDKFADPFVHESVVKVEVGDRELTPAKVRDLIDALPEGDFDRIFAAAYMLNRAPGGDPKESRYSTGSLS